MIESLIQDKLFEETLGKLEAWNVGQRDSEKLRKREQWSKSGAGGAHYQCNPNFLALARAREWIRTRQEWSLFFL